MELYKIQINVQVKPLQINVRVKPLRLSWRLRILKVDCWFTNNFAFPLSFAVPSQRFEVGWIAHLPTPQSYTTLYPHPGLPSTYTSRNLHATTVISNKWLYIIDCMTITPSLDICLGCTFHCNCATICYGPTGSCNNTLPLFHCFMYIRTVAG